MGSKSPGLGYCQDVRWRWQFPTKSSKSESSSRSTHWGPSWPLNLAHGLLEALVSRVGDTSVSTEQCMAIYAEPFPAVSGWLLKPRRPIQSRQRIQATSNMKDSLVQQTAVFSVILPYQSQAQNLNPAWVYS